jgi:diguanylate cyclase (GGDEF)-like protein
MSVVHHSRTTKERRRRAVRPVAIRPFPGSWAARRWALWSAPKAFRNLVLVVDGLALLVIVLTATVVAVGGRDLVWFAVLAGLSVLHLEANRRIERLRELATEGTQYVDLKSIWTFAGLVLLPPPLVAALIVVTYAHSWLRINRKILPHRWVFSAATIVLASAAGGAILAAAFPSTYPALPHGLAGVAAVAAAAIARWLVNSALVVIAMLTMSVALRQALRNVFGTPMDDLIEFASLSLGAGVALILVTDAPWLLVLVVPVLAIHRGIMLRQFQHAAQRDVKTGLFNGAFWHELAGKHLERAQRLGKGAGLLLLHVDGFDSIAQRHGSAVGDRVLRLVADALRGEIGEEDLPARLSGEEFVVLLPDVASTAELGAVAERLRAAIRAVELEVDGRPAVTGLTASVGGAVYPDNGQRLDELMLAVDNAMFAAKTYVRDQVRLVVPEKRLRQL